MAGSLEKSVPTNSANSVSLTRRSSGINGRTWFIAVPGSARTEFHSSVRVLVARRRRLASLERIKNGKVTVKRIAFSLG